MLSPKMQAIMDGIKNKKAGIAPEPEPLIPTPELADVDTLLDTPIALAKVEKLDDLDRAIIARFLLEDPTPKQEPIEIVELPAGQIDPRMKLLSHSSRTMLHTCPRKFQLYRLSSKEIDLEEVKGIEQGVTFAYGKAVGVGIQSVLEGKSEVQYTLDTFLEWDVDLLDETPRQDKSFWMALFAVQKFAELSAAGFLEDYELVYYKGKPAVELSFIVTLPNGYKYRGYLDGVLRHKVTGEIVVLECKTTSSKTVSAQYKNSGQGVGYSVILDKMFADLSSYTVLYLVYESKSYQYVELPFEKSLLQRALWLQELLIDTEIISLYNSYDTYPMHGESCYNFFRECEYLGLCTLSTENLVKPLTTAKVAEIESEIDNYDFVIDFNELIQSQLDKGTAPTDAGESNE